MKVCILTEGGEDIGFGHITRCTAIYEALQERAVQPIFIINGDASARQQLKDSGRGSISFDWLNDTKKLLSLIKNADIVFIDSYLADYNLYEDISKTAKTAVYFDDEIRMNYPEGFVVNGAILAEQMPYPEREGITYLLGAKYTPLRREFWDAPTKPIRHILETVMITFGGADVCNLMPKVLKLLVDAYPRLNKKVVIGKGFRNISEIEAVKDHNTELMYYPDAEEMKRVMLEADVAISAGGQTLYELARMGLATIGICVAKNQLQNIEGWTKSSFLEYVGWCSDASLEERLRDSLLRFNCAGVREEKAAIGQRFVDGQGSKRIVNVIIAA